MGAALTHTWHDLMISSLAKLWRPSWDTSLSITFSKVSLLERRLETTGQGRQECTRHCCFAAECPVTWWNENLRIAQTQPCQQLWIHRTRLFLQCDRHNCSKPAQKAACHDRITPDHIATEFRQRGGQCHHHGAAYGACGGSPDPKVSLINGGSHGWSIWGHGKGKEFCCRTQVCILHPVLTTIAADQNAAACGCGHHFRAIWGHRQCSPLLVASACGLRPICTFVWSDPNTKVDARDCNPETIWRGDGRGQINNAIMGPRKGLPSCTTIWAGPNAGAGITSFHCGHLNTIRRHDKRPPRIPITGRHFCPICAVIGANPNALSASYCDFGAIWRHYNWWHLRSTSRYCALNPICTPI